MKPIVSSSLLLALLCGPAVADAPKAKVDPKADSTATYLIDFTSKTSHHTLVVADRSCGEVQVKAPQYESFFRVCARMNDDAKSVRLEVDRKLREKDTESRQFAVVVASAAASYDWLDGKITVKTQ